LAAGTLGACSARIVVVFDHLGYESQLAQARHGAAVRE
jgi:hypothetical protein